jgi:predicted phosphodiesterase
MKGTHNSHGTYVQKYDSKKDSARSTVYYHTHVKKDLKKKPCVNCGSTKNVQFDHNPTYDGSGKWRCDNCHAKVTAKRRVRAALNA